MIDNKPNDWMLLTMDNPNFSLSRFADVGITPDNTSLQSRDFYKNNNYIRQQFSDPSTGKFDEVKFNNWYNNAATSYSQFAQNQYENDLYADLEFDPMSNLRPVGSKVKTPQIRIEKIANPWRTKQNVSRLGWINSPEKSDLELASASKVFNSETGQFEDYTADDMSLFSNPVKFLDSIINPLVLATYDEDGYHTDPISGRQVWHNKGENKTNENGDFYFETLGNRPIYGKKIKSAFDSLTAESSSLNKYDFFDSDDLQKSVTGTIFKTAAQIAPLFTPLAPYYGAAMVGKEMLNIFPMVYNSTIGNLTDSPDFLNRLTGINAALSSTTSDYSSKNMLSFENLMNIVSDVVLQQQQQRTIFNWMNELSGNAKRAKDIEGNMKNFFEFQDAVRKGNQTASNAALAYMAMTQGLDTYNEGIQLGLSKPEAALTAWGAMIGMYAVDKTGIGEIFFPELEAGQAAARGAAKQTSKIFAEAFDNSIIKAPKSKNKLVNLFNTALEKSQKHWSINNNITGFWDAVKTHSLTLMGKTIGEGLEEVAEEAVTDLAKSTFNLYSYITGRKNEKEEQLTFDILETAPERYGMNFLGGAIGGAIFGGKMIVTGENLSGQTKQELVYLIRNGQTREILDQLDDLRDKGKLGNRNIRAKYDIIKNEQVDKDGNKTVTYDKVWQSAQNEEESQNQQVYEATKAYILALDKAIHQSGFDMSDDDVMNKFISGNFRLGILLDNDLIQEGFRHEILDEFQNMSSEYADLVSKQVQLTDKQERQIGKAQESGIDISSESLSDEDKSKLKKLGITEEDRQLIKQINDTDKRIKELDKKREEFFSGKYAVGFLSKLLFQMDVLASQAFYTPTFSMYVKQKTGKELSEFSQEQLQGLEQEYKKEINTKEIANLAFEVSEQLNKQFAPQISDQEEKQRKMQEFSEYIRQNLFSLTATYGDEKMLGKYGTHVTPGILGDESFTVKVGDKQLEHIETVDQILSGIIGYDQNIEEWYYINFGKNSNLVVNRDFILLPEDSANISVEQTLAEIQKIQENESLTQEQKDAQLQQLNTELEGFKQRKEFILKHNQKVLENLKNLLSKIKEFGVIDSETKEILSKTLRKIFEPTLSSIANKKNIDKKLFDYFSPEDLIGFSFDNISTRFGLLTIADYIINNYTNKESDIEEYIKSTLSEKIPFALTRDIILKILNDPNVSDDIKSKLEELGFINESGNWVNDDYGDYKDATDDQLTLLTHEFGTLVLPKEIIDKYNLEQITQDFINRLYDGVFKPLLNDLNSNDALKEYKDLHYTIVQQESPLHDFIDKLSIAIFGTKLSIFEFFKNQDDLIEASENIADYVLTKNATDELQQAIYLLNIMQSLIHMSENYAIENFDPNPMAQNDHVFGHNQVIIDFAKEHGLDVDYKTLPSDLASQLHYEIGLLESRLQFISDLNDANSINQFKEHSKTEKKALDMFIKAFKCEAEFEFLKHLSVEIDDKKYSLLDGVEDITVSENGDINSLRKDFDKIQLKIYENFQKIQELSGKSQEVLIEEFLNNIVTVCPSILFQATSKLNSRITNVSEFDVMNLILSSAIFNKQEFDFLLNDSLSSEDGIAPLFSQQLSIFVGSALYKSPEIFNIFVNTLQKAGVWKNNIPSFENIIFISGIGGAGKTKVVARLIYKIAKKQNPDLKVIRSGPTDKQLENLSEAIPEGTNYTIENIIKEIIGKEAFDELKSELENKYDKNKTYKYLKLIEAEGINGQKASQIVLDLSALTIGSIDCDIMFLDEVSFVNNVYLKILSEAAKKNNFKIITTGDLKQQYQEPKIEHVGNIDKLNCFMIRTPELSISMRVQNIQKKGNNDLLIPILDKIWRKSSQKNMLLNDLHQLQFHYYEQGGILYGDKLVKGLSQEEIKNILESNKTVAFVYDNADSETKKNLDKVLETNPDLSKKVTILTKEEVQGSEFDQVIIDLQFSDIPDNEDFKWFFNEFCSTMYTMSTRGKQGVYFIDRGISDKISFDQFIKDKRTDVTKDTKEIIKNFRDEYFEYLKSALEGYTPPTYRKSEAEAEKDGEDGEEEELKDPKVDETFEDLIDESKPDKPLILNNDERKEPSPEEIKVSQGLKNIRSYCFYTRIGCKPNDRGRYVRRDGDNSDLNAILDVEGNSTANDTSLERFDCIKTIISTGQVLKPEVMKQVKTEHIFSGFDASFLDSVQNGEYYIEGRKTDPDYDTDPYTKDFDLAAIGDQSINIVYKFKHKGKEYSITVSILADPDTWLKFLNEKGLEKSEAEKYKKFYENIVADIKKGKNVLKILPKEELKFLNFGRLVKVYDEEGNQIFFDGDTLKETQPRTLVSDRLFIYGKDDDFMDVSLKGTRAISLQCGKWIWALNQNGEYEKITPKNMYRLFQVSKDEYNRAKKAGDPSKAKVDCAIRAVVMESKPQYIFSGGTKENPRPGVFDIDIVALKKQYPTTYKKILSTRRNRTAVAKIIQTLWHDLIMLQKIKIWNKLGYTQERINTFLKENKFTFVRGLSNPAEIVSKDDKHTGGLLLNEKGVDGYQSILAAFFEELEGFINLPMSVENVLNADKDTELIGFKIDKNLQLVSGDLITFSKDKQAKFQLKAENGEVDMVSSNANLDSIVVIAFSQIFNRITGNRKGGREEFTIEDYEKWKNGEKNLRPDILFLYDDGSYAKLKDSESKVGASVKKLLSIDRIIDKIADFAKLSGAKSLTRTANSVFNSLLHGTFDVDNEKSVHINKTRANGKSVVPFPRGIFFHAVYEKSKTSEGAVAEGYSLYAAINSYDQFKQGVLVESGMIYFSTDKVKDVVAPEKTVITSKFNIGDRIVQKRTSADDEDIIYDVIDTVTDDTGSYYILENYNTKKQDRILITDIDSGEYTKISKSNPKPHEEDWTDQEKQNIQIVEMLGKDPKNRRSLSQIIGKIRTNIGNRNFDSLLLKSEGKSVDVVIEIGDDKVIKTLSSISGYDKNNVDNIIISNENGLTYFEVTFNDGSRIQYDVNGEVIVKDVSPEPKKQESNITDQDIETLKSINTILEESGEDILIDIDLIQKIISGEFNDTQEEIDKNISNQCNILSNYISQTDDEQAKEILNKLQTEGIKSC